MAIEIVLPQVGATSLSAKIVRWHSPEGGHVVEGQALYVFDVAGVETQVEAPATGTLRINAGLDRSYDAGTVLGLIE